MRKICIIAVAVCSLFGCFALSGCGHQFAQRSSLGDKALFDSPESYRVDCIEESTSSVQDYTVDFEGISFTGIIIDEKRNENDDSEPLPRNTDAVSAGENFVSEESPAEVNELSVLEDNIGDPSPQPESPLTPSGNNENEKDEEIEYDQIKLPCFIDNAQKYESENFRDSNPLNGWDIFQIRPKTAGSDAPKDIKKIITAEDEFKEIFDDFPISINFSECMAIMYVFTCNQMNNRYDLDTLNTSNGTLYVKIDMLTALGYGTATNGMRRIFLVITEKTPIDNVEIEKSYRIVSTIDEALIK